MFALIWGAVRTRRAQVLTVLVLTALAAAVAAAGPWFAAAGGARAAAADVAGAPAGDRTLSIRTMAETRGDPQGTLDQFAANTRGLLPLPATDPVSGLVLPLIITRGTDTPSMAIAYRDGLCDHLRLAGRCPAAAGEAAISVNAAQTLGLGPGGRLQLRTAPDAKPLVLRVVATYALDDPGGAYWSNPLFLAGGGLDPAFTPVGTFRSAGLTSPTITYDVRVPDRLVRGDDGYDLGAVLRAAHRDLSAAQLLLVNSTGPLLGAIARDREAIDRGVLVAVLQVLVLAWFAIGLAGHYTGRDRRGDAALLKLRGAGRGAVLRLAWGQHLVPLTLGALAGLPLGYLLARTLVGSVPRAADRQDALVLSAAAAAAVLVGGLAVLALIEAVALRRPVADLLREITGGRGGWRGGLADLLLLTVAVAAIYQARAGLGDQDRAGSAGRTGAGSAGETVTGLADQVRAEVAGRSGLELAAPALVALAVALLLARLLARIADRGGGAAVRAGRLRLGLTAVQVSRQPGSDRVFALIVVAVAVFVTAVGGYVGERTARLQRAAAELGAPRVLTVQAPNRTVLLRAVRRADPAGDQAMAAVLDTTTSPPILAVDTTRLAAVARWRPEYGPVTALLTPPGASLTQPGGSPATHPGGSPATPPGASPKLPGALPASPATSPSASLTLPGALPASPATSRALAEVGSAGKSLAAEPSSPIPRASPALSSAFAASVGATPASAAPAVSSAAPAVSSSAPAVSSAAPAAPGGGRSISAGPGAFPAVTGRGLAVRVDYSGSGTAELTLTLQHEGSGAPVVVRFGRLAAGEQTLRAPVAGCAAAPGCRVLRWELTGPAGATGSVTSLPPGTSVAVRGLEQVGPPAVILDGARLGDIALWRSGGSGAALDLAAAGGVLTLSVGGGPGPAGTAVHAVDTELPMPVVLAGPAPAHWQFGEPAVLAFGREPTPVRVAGGASGLPVVGRQGLLTDLDATRRVIGDGVPPGRFQVWLAGDARPGIVGALEREGLTVAADESIGERAASLADQAPAVVTRFSLVAGLVVLLLGAAALAVAGAVDRRFRLEQLRALRVQGLARAGAVVIAYAGIASLVVAGLAGGLIAALLARPVARITVPAFADGWDVLPPPSALGLAGFALGAVIALLVLGLSGWLALLPLTRRLRRESTGGPPATPSRRTPQEAAR